MLRKFIKFGCSSKSGPAQLFHQRKLLYQCTSDALFESDFLQKQQKKRQIHPLSVYCGYDPTADSLHLGNLVSIIMMSRLQGMFSLRPIFLLGGATGLIGDPSGKKQERDLIAQERVKTNLESIRMQIMSVYTKITQDMQNNKDQYGLSLRRPEKIYQPLFIDNFSFYKQMSVLAYLRDIGKVLRMNSLLAKQIVANRLESDSGISYTEFSYSILQSYDFYRLNKDYGCILQFGGSDQWGNITNGCDLTKKLSKGQYQGYGITMPLLLSKTGQKFGKSQGNALFLNNNKTPISNVYDYFFNTADDQIQRLLLIFTLFSPQKIKQIIKVHKQKPEQRVAQKILASKVTAWLGAYKNLKEELQKSKQENLKSKQIKQLQQIFESLPSDMKGEINKSEFSETIKFLPDLLVKFGVYKSKNQCRKDIEGEGVYINNSKVPKNYGQVSITEILDKNMLKGKFILFRKGKKKYLLLKIID